MRMTIYVKDDLHQQMSAHNKGMNWSAIASRAFTHAVEDSRKPEKGSRMLCRCESCSWFGRQCHAHPVQHLRDRVLPGERMPAGDCPVCGRLVYPSQEPICFTVFDTFEWVDHHEADAIKDGWFLQHTPKGGRRIQAAKGGPFFDEVEAAAHVRNQAAAGDALCIHALLCLAGHLARCVADRGATGSRRTDDVLETALFWAHAWKDDDQSRPS